MAAEHTYCVHDPGHYLRVSVDIGSWDIAIGADNGKDLCSISARHAFQLVARELMRIDYHSALAAAVWDIHNSAFPRHPRSEGFNFNESYLRVIADAAFGRAARHIMLHAVSFKDLDAAIVHLYRN